MNPLVRRMAIFIDGVSPSMKSALLDQWKAHPLLWRLGGIFEPDAAALDSGSAIFCLDGVLSPEEMSFEGFKSKVVAYEMREGAQDLDVDTDSNVVLVITGSSARLSTATRIAKEAAELPGGREMHWLHLADEQNSRPVLDGGDAYCSGSSLFQWLRDSLLFESHQVRRFYDVRNENLYEFVSNDGVEWAHSAILLMESAQFPSKGARDEELGLYSIAFCSVEMPLKLAYDVLDGLSREALVTKELAPTNFHATSLACREVLVEFGSVFVTEKQTMLRPEPAQFLPNEGRTMAVIEDYDVAFSAFVEYVKRDRQFLLFEEKYKARLGKYEEAIFGTLKKGEGSHGLTLAQRVSRLRYFMGQVDDLSDGAPLSPEMSAASVGWNWIAEFGTFHPSFSVKKETEIEEERQIVQEKQAKSSRLLPWGSKEPIAESLPSSSVEQLIEEMKRIEQGMSTTVLSKVIEDIRERNFPRALPAEEKRPKVFTRSLFRKMAVTVLPFILTTWLWTAMFGWNPIQSGWTSWVVPAGLASVSISIWVVYIAWLLTHKHDSRRSEEENNEVLGSLEDATKEAFDLIVNWMATGYFIKSLGSSLSRLRSVHQETEAAMLEFAESGSWGGNFEALDMDTPNSMLSLVNAESLRRYFEKSLAPAINQRQDLGPLPEGDNQSALWIEGVWHDLHEFVKERCWNLKELNVLRYLMDDEYRTRERFPFVSDDFPATNQVMGKVSKRIELLLFKGRDLNRRDIVMRMPVSGSIGDLWDQQIRAGLEGAAMVDFVDSYHPHRLGFLRISQVESID